MAIFSLNESFSVVADWFRPEKPDQQIRGTLNYDGRSLELSLEHTFAPLEGAIFGRDTFEIPLLHGETGSGEPITVIRARRSGMTVSLGRWRATQPDQLDARIALRGVHTDQNPTFPELSCRVPGLPPWLWSYAIKCQVEEEPPALLYHVATLPAISLRIPSVSAVLELDTVSTGKSRPFSLSVETIGTIRIVPEAPQNLDWYLSQLDVASALLDLCAGVPMPADCITVPAEAAGHRASILGRGYRKPCSLSALHEFFLTRLGLGDQLEPIFQSWFEHYPRVETTCGLARSILGTNDLWPQVEFLSLMQALEGLHRALFEGFYMNQPDYGPVEGVLCDAVDGLPKAVSPDHRRALKSRIHYGNELSLAKRLNLLCSMLSEPVRQILFGDARRIPRKWIETRNYYTHWEPSLLPGILGVQEMVDTNVRMRALLRVLYLSLAGVSQEVLYRSLTGSNAEGQALITIRGVERRASNPNDMTGSFGFVTRGKSAAPSADDKHGS